MYNFTPVVLLRHPAELSYFVSSSFTFYITAQLYIHLLENKTFCLRLYFAIGTFVV
jgi:hypothetical protein